MMRWMLVVSFALLCATPFPAVAQDARSEDKPAAKADDDKKKEGWVEVKIDLPKPVFKGTPKNAPPGTNLEPPRRGPRPPFQAPRGVKNVAKGKKLKVSDSEPIIGEVKFINDGQNEALEGSYVEFGPGLQWAQIDLGEEYEIYGILFWHFHANARIYHDVVVQVADDEDFIKNVRTLFNNDHDNSSGLGLGEDKEYWETYEGKLVEADGVKARYLRLYSNGSIADDQNHYIEVEVYAKPAK